MPQLRTWLVSGAVLLPLAHCAPRLGRLEVPGQVQASAEFLVSVHANDPGGLHGGVVGCVVQLPIGVSITGAVAWHDFSSLSPVTVTRDTPALLAAYTAEPGHYLASFDANVMAMYGALTLKVLAPAAGSVDLKVAIAADWTGWTNPGGWTAIDPAGVTDFASIGGAFAATCTVVADAPPFVLTTAGLPPTLDAVACGDVDGDGNDDLVGVRTVAGNTTLHACLSHPGGSFTVTSTNVPASTVVALGQLDGDGWLDVVLGGHVWFGTGTGSFTQGPAFAFSSNVTHVTTGDVDGDGLHDIAFVAQPSYARVLRSNGNRTFSDWSTGLPGPAAPNVGFGRLVLRDVTHDGFADLVIPYTTPRLDVCVGNGLGQWTVAPPLTTAGPPQQIDVGDVTGDGRADIVAALSSPSQLCEIWTNPGGNQWSLAPVPAIAGTAASGLVLLDHDRDGLLDIVGVDAPNDGTYSMWTRMRLLRNTGPGGFVEVVDPGLATFGATQLWLATGDLDGDTFPDLAAPAVAVLAWRNTRSGVSPYGAGCAGAGHAPYLAANGQPLLGNAGFAMELHDGLANGAGLMWVGFSKRWAFGQPQLPFALAPFGAPGCFVIAEQIAVRVLVHDAQGVGAMPLALPNDPGLDGLLLFWQGAAFVPGANSLGVLCSGGIATRLY